MRTSVFTLLILGLLAAVPVKARAQELPEEGRIVVVQEKKFKQGFDLSLAAGILPLDAFYKGITGQLGVSWHYSPFYAWEIINVAYSKNFGTGLRRELLDNFGVQPTRFEEVQLIVNSDFMIKPLYGKHAWMNRKTMHSEIYFVGGGNAMKLSASFRPGVNLGFGFRSFLSDHLSWRFDFRDYLYVNGLGSGTSFSIKSVLSISSGVTFSL